MVKNLPANAGDMGLIPGLGIFHMPGSTTETACPRGHRPQLESNLHSLQLEKACVQQQKPSIAYIYICICIYVCVYIYMCIYVYII